MLQLNESNDTVAKGHKQRQFTIANRKRTNYKEILGIRFITIAKIIRRGKNNKQVSIGKKVTKL